MKNNQHPKEKPRAVTLGQREAPPPRRLIKEGETSHDYSKSNRRIEEVQGQ